METITLEFKIDKSTWQQLDPEQERHLLSIELDDLLKKHQIGKWSGSAEKAHSLIFYCLVDDAALAWETISNALAGNKLIRFIDTCKA